LPAAWRPGRKSHFDMQWFIDRIQEPWVGVAALALMAGGVWWMMPRRVNLPKAVGLIAALIGAFVLASRIRAADTDVGRTILFSVLATAAVACAILMITNRNPVYSALWFALVTLNVCGLFWLQAAQFLAAATVIVYAGAIVVTFIFVIMLAQQAGATVYDQRSRQPLFATMAAFLLLGALLSTLRAAKPDDVHLASPDSVVTANVFSHQPKEKQMDAEMMKGLGRSLFGDYLFAVELAGTLLLVATIGAIAIAPRRSRGTL
jgi:NADH-quinone oxidoreductase subunit J